MKTIETIPILRIFDEEAAKAFYIDFLGFSIDWEHRFEEDFPLYMQISLDSCHLHLTGHHGDCCPGSAIMLDVSGLKAYQRCLLAKKYKHSRPGVDKTDWGTLEMTIADPFGNRITFSERLTENQ
ncbi:MAG: glyoxalase/bleomycin resistance/extradiol dioxygenase family protein [Kangiellaceae bacterium]|nr:glyoxalase/bleomycin resistance/extradiol dioxygenase family protein [Kangiellaceae bacterium]